MKDIYGKNNAATQLRAHETPLILISPATNAITDTYEALTKIMPNRTTLRRFALFIGYVSLFQTTSARLADRSRVVKARGGRRDKNNLAIEGAAYRIRQGGDYDAPNTPTENDNSRIEEEVDPLLTSTTNRKLRGQTHYESPEFFSRRLSSQLTGCCYTYQSYSAADMCSLYGEDCESGETPSHDSGDGTCTQQGLSFIGISFSVNTASGNPYSYQLCDQFPMENIIDRNYKYVMSLDEDGWLVGGGYKSFDYSGKMP